MCRWWHLLKFWILKLNVAIVKIIFFSTYDFTCIISINRCGHFSCLHLFFFLFIHLYRIKKHIFTSSEVELLAEAIICLFLDRQFQGLTVLLCECVQSLIHYFIDEEWKACCDKIAKSLVCRYYTLPSYVKYLGYANWRCMWICMVGFC